MRRRLLQLIAGAQPAGVGGSPLRTALVLLAATLLPLAIYSLVSIAVALRNDREATEAASQDRAARIAEALDGRLDVIAAVMRALGTIRSIPARDWAEARRRAGEIASIDADWRDVALVDASDGRTLFRLREAGRSETDGVEAAHTGLRYGEVAFGHVTAMPGGAHSLVATMPIRRPGSAGYLLRVSLDPSPGHRQR